jgi:alpha-beta hydrolase superfamily lysophospholipase
MAIIAHHICMRYVGTRVPLRFLKGLISARSAVAPELFSIPILLAQPSADRWTPLWKSMLFFERIGGSTEIRVLEIAGHLPIKEPGIRELPYYANRFIRTTLKGQ